MIPGHHINRRKHSIGLPDHCTGCPVIQSTFFNALNRPTKEMITCMMVYGKYRRRQVLYQEGNPATRVYALKTGLVKTVKTHPWGKEQLIDVLRPGDIFNLESLSGGNCSVTAEVLTDSEMCFFESRKMLEMSARSSPLALEIIRLLSESLNESRERILDLGTKSAKSRLAGFLLDLVPFGRENGGHELVLDLPLTRREIADLIGVRLETASRLFLDLKEKRIVSTQGREVHIRDMRRLKASAK